MPSNIPGCFLDINVQNLSGVRQQSRVTLYKNAKRNLYRNV
jgi:hypothetical protein